MRRGWFEGLLTFVFVPSFLRSKRAVVVGYDFSWLFVRRTDSRRVLWV